MTDYMASSGTSDGHQSSDAKDMKFIALKLGVSGWPGHIQFRDVPWWKNNSSGSWMLEWVWVIHRMIGDAHSDEGQRGPETSHFVRHFRTKIFRSCAPPVVMWHLSPAGSGKAVGTKVASSNRRWEFCTWGSFAEKAAPGNWFCCMLLMEWGRFHERCDEMTLSSYSIVFWLL